MIKEEVIVIRVSAEEKENWEKAARERHKSLTSFLRDAAKKEARKEPPKVSPRAFRGVPTFFKALCAEARQGGANNYGRAGHEFTRHLASSMPYEFDEEEWFEQLDNLQSMIEEERDFDAWNWFREYFPKCMELVPNRRKDQFLAGGKEYLENNQLY